MTAPTHALSIRQPWASAIVHGSKRIENRTWRPTAQLLVGPFPIWIHASSLEKPVPEEHGAIAAFQRSPAGLTALRQGLKPTDPVPLAWSSLPTRSIIGAAIVERVVGPLDQLPPGQEQWWAGPLAWVLRDVVALSEPVRASGRLSLWRPTPEVQAACVARLPAGWAP